ncbi:MAG: 2-amino-4-hydroxy-6-hydroxymethyldihydropteridine diphosphokinase [Dehalococcoidia bacterium]|nr:2-amino-4-hydroxy-6-hydroxymethyldihydropteridine diphosphokinase [Dehalococcoidia bacterium]
MTGAVLALGSNLGDRAANLRAAVRLLREAGVTVVRCSSAWETPPVPADQPSYLNAAVRIETDAGPLQLLALAKGIEHTLGRRPERRWGPRPIDVDILFHGAGPVDLPGLTIPHPRIAERAFVLAPLAEAWEGELPVLARRAVDLLAALPQGHGARRTGELLS